MVEITELHQKKISELPCYIVKKGDSFRIAVTEDDTMLSFKLIKEWGVAVIKYIIRESAIPSVWLNDREGKLWGFTGAESDMFLIFFLMDKLEITEENLK